MSLQLYMDHHIHGAITRGLRRRQVNVLTAEEDDREDLPDALLLTRATELNRIFVSYDQDLIVEATRRQMTNERFYGLVRMSQWAITIGQAVEQLHMICEINAARDVENQIIWVPM